MTPQPSKVPCSDISPAENEPVSKAPFVKAPYVKPQLICHGAIADLIQTFGGSLTPEEREAEGLD